MKNTTEPNELNEDNSVLIHVDARVPLIDGLDIEELTKRMGVATAEVLGEGSQYVVAVVEKIDDNETPPEDYISDDNNESVHVPELWAAVQHITYDFVGKELIIYQSAYSCVDMSGAIKFAQRIDPNVGQIQTMAGGKTDMLYVRIEDKWSSHTPVDFNKKG